MPKWRIHWLDLSTFTLTFYSPRPVHILRVRLNRWSVFSIKRNRRICSTSEAKHCLHRNLSWRYFWWDWLRCGLIKYQYFYWPNNRTSKCRKFKSRKVIYCCGHWRCNYAVPFYKKLIKNLEIIQRLVQTII